MRIYGYNDNDGDDAKGEPVVQLADWGRFLAAAIDEWGVDEDWVRYACEKPWKWRDELAYFVEHGELPEDE